MLRSASLLAPQRYIFKTLQHHHLWWRWSYSY